MAHKALDDLLDSVDRLGSEGRGFTLKDLSEHFIPGRQPLLARCLEAAVKERYGAELKQEIAACPRCAKTLRRKRFDDKEVSTLQGRFTLHRPYFHCTGCEYGFHPLDELLGLSESTHQYDIQERSTRLGAELPFELSEREFEALTGVKAGQHFIHETLNAVGEAATLELVVPERAEIEEAIAEVQGASRRRPVLVIACDGANAPTRPKARRKEKRGAGSWKEVKGVRLYLLRGDRIVHLVSWHQIGTADQLDPELGLIAGRIPSEKVRIGLVGDGAGWVWNLMIKHFPQGRQVLDYYHCKEHVYDVARAQFGEGTPEGREWVEGVMTRLCLDEVGRAIADLRQMTTASQTAAEEIRKLIGYLETHRHRLGYNARRRQSMPLGSGGIESANKFISHVRLKRSGAWWLEPNGNAMLRLRCAIYNGTFKRVFAHYMSKASTRFSDCDK